MDGKFVTDESECEYWSCNNTYTQCNGFWSCQNGADELHCSPSDCPLFHYRCIFPNDTSKVSCLSINHFGNGIIDCIGGTDELYQQKHFDVFFGGSYFINYFQCQNNTKRISFGKICNRISDCPLSDDETFCKNYSEDFLREFERRIEDQASSPVFLLKNLPIYSIQTINDMKLLTKTQLIQTHASTIVPENTIERWCKLGLPIHVRNDDIYCLCPPGYYGDQCEYENERVSLTFQIIFSSNWKNLFIFVVTLVDNERNIQSYHSFDYSSITHCDMKFNIYLLYSNRPKNLSKTYSVQIDLLNKISFNYRSSWIYPIKYSFLPVYRLSVLLKVPIFDSIITNRCNPSCIHGQCSNYVNSPNSTFCRCHSGWSGIQCNIKVTYLIILREKEIFSGNISTKIDPLYRCLSINVNQYYLKRIKYYPRLCRERDQLICFYDKNQICFCDVNCFEFNHNMTYNCREHNCCQNEGQCFFNKDLCPTLSICVCKQCYFGSQCQFSTKGSTLSLDIILGSHIIQNTKITKQTIF